MAESQIFAIVMFVLGWLGGLLSPQFVNEIRRRNLKVSLSSAIASELSELRVQAVSIAYMVRSKHGAFTRETLSWTSRQLEGTDIGTSVSDLNGEPVSLLLLISRLLEMSDSDLSTLALRARQQSADQHLSFRVFSAPFLNSHLHEIDVFPIVVQRELLAIVRDLGRYNELADEARRFADRTFNESLSPENRRALIGNVRVAEGMTGNSCTLIADRIANLKL